MTNSTGISLLLLLIGLATGCEKSGTQTVPVHGKLTFAGGPPPAAGAITFIPLKVQDGMPRRPGSAHFNEQGDFKVTSFKENDGLVPGTYTVRIECWMGNPNSDDPSSFERLNYVPSGFQPPDIQVDPNAGSVEVKLDVPKKK